jgi:hypothetical protein
MNTINPQLVQNFFADYISAEKELTRPKEDVVSLSVCITVKSAIHKILMLYLQSKNSAEIQSGQNHTLRELTELCSQYNNLFSSIDYSPLLCFCEIHSAESPRIFWEESAGKKNISRYCISVQKTQECFFILKQIKKIVFDELKIIPKSNDE